MSIFKDGIPTTYKELCMVHMPRPIRDSVGCEKAMELIDALAGLPLNSDQDDYLDILAGLVEEYERRTLPQLKINPLEVINCLVEENGVTTRELGKILGVDHSAASRILKGKRSITVKHAKNLGNRFKLDPAVFLNLKTVH